MEDVLHQILESYLEGEEYNANRCGQLTQNLTDVIETRIKEMHFPRYKLVCHVVIGNKLNQWVRCVSRCLWDKSTDLSATATYENQSLFAVATVYGLYFE